MRPPEFTGGNAVDSERRSVIAVVQARFNEAAGIHRRKLEAAVHALRLWSMVADASMRPPEFTGGNPRRSHVSSRYNIPASFNEAAGIHRRKHGRDEHYCDRPTRWPSFNEAAGIHRRKPPA